MAKRKRNIKKKHSSGEESTSFLEGVPEKSETEWTESSEVDMHEERTQDPAEETMNLAESHSAQQSPSQVDQIFEELDKQNESQEVLEEDSQDPIHSGFSLGSYLREQRENRGISLKNVSQSTKISLTNLEFLELDDLPSLPDRAYVTGYVKSYAKLIGADVNLCLDLLDKTYQLLGESPREPEIVIPQAQNSPQIASNSPMSKVAVVAAMIAVLGAIVIFFASRKDAKEVNGQEIAEIKSEEEELKEITPQTLNAETPLQNDLPEGEIVQNDEPAVEEEVSLNEPTEQKVVEAKVAEKKAEEKPAPKPEEKKVTETKEEEKKATETKEEEKRKFYPLSTPLYTVDESLTQDQMNELLPADSRINAGEGKQAIFITANKGDSWLTYKKDDDQIKKFVLKKGRTLLFVADEARVFLGNIGAVKIFLNNKPLKISSRTGVKSLVFPQENASSYVMPLFIYKEDGTVTTSKEWIDENQN